MIVLCLLALQGSGPAVTAGVDHARLRVGEELAFTVQARTRSADALTLIMPSLAGFAILGSSERTEVAMSGAGGPLRTTSRQLVLRAARAGTMTIGPVRVQQGKVTVATNPITIVVDSATAGAEAGLSPLAHALLLSAPPPRRNDQVALTTVVPAETVLVGQQVDLVVVAWLPRELRSRLRRPPIVTLPTPGGVWAYPQVAPGAVVAARQVRGQWMDLFAVHQVMFPLAPGRVIVPQATVEYALPVTFSFFSREDRYTLVGDSSALVVQAVPTLGRSTGEEAGLVGRDFTLDVTIEPADTRVGEPVEVAATVRGVGNVALWPEPHLAWPTGFRPYPAQITTGVTPRDGLIAGTKTFRYLVVPDSAGSFLLPEVRYPYFDLATGGETVVRTAPRALAVAPGAEPRAARALPALKRDEATNPADEIAGSVPLGGWVALFLGPPLLMVWRRRRSGAGTAVAPASASLEGPAPQWSALGRLEREFHVLLVSHVPDAFAREGDALARALRAAGVESAVADHVMRLRDRLRAARYGPRGVGDPAELGAELEQVLRVLGAETSGRRRRRVRVSVAGLALLGVCTASAGVWAKGRAATAQAPSAEALYDAGALRAAADSFAARAAAAPDVAAHWYNLGATLYRAGADGKAIAAWTTAARLAPRDGVIRRARTLLPLPDVASEPLLAVGPGTPGEWGLLGGGLWVVAWLVAAFERRRLAVVLGVLAAAAVTLGGLEMRRRAMPVAVVVAPATPVRVAPYGSASAAASMEAGAALLVEQPYGRWLEVRRDDGVHGWILMTEVTRL